MKTLLRKVISETKQLLQRLTAMERINAVAEVYQGDVSPTDWVVEAIDPSGDGGIYIASFSGPEAEARAVEYASEKFVGFRRHEPHPQTYEPDRRKFVLVVQ